MRAYCVPCFLAYSILFSFTSCKYSLLYNPFVSKTVTITTGGVPDGMRSPPPSMLDSMKRKNPNAHAPMTIDLTLLRRIMGKEMRDVRAYGESGGLEDFRVGSARCIVSRDRLSPLLDPFLVLFCLLAPEVTSRYCCLACTPICRGHFISCCFVSVRLGRTEDWQRCRRCGTVETVGVSEKLSSPGPEFYGAGCKACRVVLGSWIGKWWIHSFQPPKSFLVGPTFTI